jgi:hypothetical protein
MVFSSLVVPKPPAVAKPVAAVSNGSDYTKAKIETARRLSEKDSTMKKLKRLEAHNLVRGKAS